MAFVEIELKRSWRTLTDALGANASSSQAVFTALAHRYSDSGRFYHTLTHVARMLDTVNVWEQSIDAENPNAIRLAVWFHDAVYDSRSADNEERSAQIARRTLERWDVPEETAETVERLILATKTHSWNGSRDGALFLDADLAILGGEPEDYAHYSHAIRQEYAWVSEADYRAGRRKVLMNFLERPHLFQTPVLADAWEDRARENLRAEIEQLRP